MAANSPMKVKRLRLVRRKPCFCYVCKGKVGPESTERLHRRRHRWVPPPVVDERPFDPPSSDDEGDEGDDEGDCEGEGDEGDGDDYYHHPMVLPPEGAL
jgi:hypothetical protein